MSTGGKNPIAYIHGRVGRGICVQFSAAADVVVALVVGARSDRQIQEDWHSRHAKIPVEFWDKLKRQGLIEMDAAVPSLPT
jgi:D-threo-aldose 1-dehydrogenase